MSAMDILKKNTSVHRII